MLREMPPFLGPLIAQSRRIDLKAGRRATFAGVLQVFVFTSLM
jgi:hypothetical protein